jgi:F0F1-type ATP synthase assembly protein I
MTTREAMPKQPYDFDGGRTEASQAGEVLGSGIQFAASILVFLFAGRWLDARLGTEPWLLLIGVFVGAGAGFYALYRQLVIRPRERQQKKKGGA